MDHPSADGPKQTTALTPIERGQAKIQPFPEHKGAAGIPGVVNSLAYTLKEAGAGRGTRVLLRVNQVQGFDCPGCAWPDPKHRAMAEFCENGARAVADEATRKRVDPAFFRNHSVQDLAKRSDYWLNQQGRITQPMMLRPGATHYESVGWEDALNYLALSLSELSDPNRAVFYTSGRTSNEAAFAYQTFVRALGTNNLPDCSNLCHESSGKGLTAAIGIGKGTVRLEDFNHADLILIFGQNPGTNHPRMLSALREAKEHGAKIVVMNPLREAALIKFTHPQKVKDILTGGVDIADQYLQVAIGGDLALCKGLCKALVAKGAVNQDFIQHKTEGYSSLVSDLEATTWDDIVGCSGIGRTEIEDLAHRLAQSKATIATWGMGVTQQRHGVATVQGIVNLLLLQGNFGKAGAGACPVRGHSNVQGDRTVGIWEHRPAWLGALEQKLGFEAPSASGYDAVGAIEAMDQGLVDVFMGMGGNFVSATPDSELTAAAMRKVKLSVHVSTKLNRSHLITGNAALILPCLGRTEQDTQGGVDQMVSVENSMGVVHSSQGGLSPASPHLRSEVWIVCELAKRALANKVQLPWEAWSRDYAKIRQVMGEVIPGFSQYNERLAAPHGFELPNGPRHGDFTTKDGKAHFFVHALPDMDKGPKAQLWMTTVRSHSQFNTTVFDLDDRYRGIKGHRRVVLMSLADIEALGLKDGHKVDLRSHFGEETREARSFQVVAYDLPHGTCVTYFPEANGLVPLSWRAEGSRTPVSKAVPVSIHIP